MRYKRITDLIFKDYFKKDKYPEMTKKAVKELWNDDRYSREGLFNIAIALLDKLSKNQ